MPNRFTSISHLRWLTTGVVLCAATLGLGAAASSARADQGATLTVVGTSDVFDSNLVQSVIEPGFEAAHPDTTLTFVPKDTGAAISYAEAGRASALIADSPALESRYVAGGYSLENYGRAVSYGDYVLAGHPADPANVDPDDSNDLASAFEAIAARGAAGTGATFVSRGGTAGTTVQEHAIWAETTGQKTSSDPVPPDGLVLCQVSAAEGGGYIPSTTPGACPDQINYPDWYVATGDTQTATLKLADACDGESVGNRDPDGCYVFSDRANLAYLQSTNPSGLNDLQIDTRDNEASTRGGRGLSVSELHAYGVDPSKFTGNPDVSINSAAAREFLDYLTSPSTQQAIGAYLADNNYGPPYRPDARPIVSTSSLPQSIGSGSTLTITGTLLTATGGSAGNVPVHLYRLPTADPSAGSKSPVMSTETDSAGGFSFSYVPTVQSTYEITTDAFDKTEYPASDFDDNLNFTDTYEASSTTLPGTVRVVGYPHVKSITGGKGVVTGSITLTPQDHFHQGSLRF